MEPIEYERMARAEDHHWWYLGMQAITRALLDRFLPARDISILDAGCGTGAAMAACLPHYGRVTGCDISPLALGYCRQRSLARIAQASVTRLPFRAASFDLVTSFDVLYERAVDDASAALDEFARVLRPRGLILLRLPAYDWLRGQHDAAVHTARRYDAPAVARLIRNSGLRILHITYANTLLFPIAAAKRLLERIAPPAPDDSDLSLEAGVFAPLLRNILSAEAPLAARIGLPFGLSVIVVAGKPDQP